MEIERKYLLDQLPENLTSYPCKKIEQGYLSTEPLSLHPPQHTVSRTNRQAARKGRKKAVKLEVIGKIIWLNELIG